MVGDGNDGATGAVGATGADGPAGPASPPGPVPDAITAAIDSAQVESCATCHGGVGDEHQAVYNQYADESRLGLTITDVQSTDIGGDDFVNSAGGFAFSLSAGNAASNGDGRYTAGTYNVPDQTESLPGVLRASWDIADRNIGTVPEFVTGPASRACGGCHRAELINEDKADEFAAFNAHTGSFGTLVENDADDFILFGIIDKIMIWLE